MGIRDMLLVSNPPRLNTFNTTVNEGVLSSFLRPPGLAGMIGLRTSHVAYLVGVTTWPQYGFDCLALFGMTWRRGTFHVC